MNFKRKKLFICITKSNWGGAQKYVYDIATNTPRDQFDTTVLLGGDGDLKNKLDAAGVKTILLKHSQRDLNILKVFLLGFSLIGIFWKEKPDIVHLNSSQMGGSGGLAARLTSVKKIIFTGHGWAFNENRPEWQKILAKIFHIFTILLSHKTIAVSQITKDQIGSPWNKKMIVIRNGVRDISLIDKKSARESLSIKILQNNPKSSNIISSNPVWIGTVSELHTTKGLNYAIEAISKLKNNIIFVIIGEGEKRKELEEQIIKLGMANRIFLLGYIDLSSIYLKAFDIITLTSITEALPYMLLEAGYASIPVLATNVGGIPEIIENNKSGLLISPQNSEEIKTGIDYLMKNPEKARILGESLKEKISKNFTQKIMLEKTFAIYNK